VLAHRRGDRKCDRCLASNVGHIAEIADRGDPAIRKVELDEVSRARIARVPEDGKHLAAIEPSRREAPIEDLVVVRKPNTGAGFRAFVATAEQFHLGDPTIAGNAGSACSLTEPIVVNCSFQDNPRI
jgi:hypothetical protein